MRVGHAGLIACAALTAACVPPPVWSCQTDAECLTDGVRGVCEHSGYCSFDDDTCDPPGRRYDDLAGDGLANRCVQPLDPMEATGETGVASETGEVPCPDACVDEDGDGAGIGPACSAVDCDDANPATIDGCAYIGPDGDDMNAGTREAPWKRFSFALAQLGDGGSLVLLDGEYNVSAESSGMIDADCSVVANGTQARPISIRAENERQALVSTDGTATAVTLRGCEHWRVTGLHVRGAELADVEPTYLVNVTGSSDIQLRRLLLEQTNGAVPGPSGLWVYESENVLVEESEIYSFSDGGFAVSGSHDVTLRALYANARGDAANVLDSGVLLVRSDGIIVENVIVQAATGASGIALRGTSGSRILGSIHITPYTGFHVYPDPAGAASRDNVVEDLVVLGPENSGVSMRTPTSVAFDRATLLGAGNNGLGADQTQPDCATLGECGFSGAHMLIADGEGSAVYAPDVDDPDIPWVVTQSNFFGNSYGVSPDDPLDDDMGRFQTTISEPADDMGLSSATCSAYVPEGGSMFERAADGQTIGANVLYRYIDGELTSAPLWDPTTKAFPCGAEVPGVNDQVGDACSSVHLTLNVGTDSCPFPSGYPEPATCP